MLCLVVTVPTTEVELAADALWALGVLGVEERSSDDAMVELWTSLGDDADTVTHAAEAFPARWRWRLVDVDDAVANAWRAHARATWVEADLVVRPAWIDFDAPAGTTVVSIEPGTTFGLGDHPTTVLALREMRSALFPGAALLDVGCGSGVLAVTACVLGAGYARAVDISAAAVEVTRANAVRNGVAGRVEVDLCPVAEVAGEFDVVVANILAPDLVSLAPDLVRLVGPSGVLVVSGVLSSRFDHVVAALAPRVVMHESQRDGWSALSLRG